MTTERASEGGVEIGFATNETPLSFNPERHEMDRYQRTMTTGLIVASLAFGILIGNLAFALMKAVVR